MCQSLQKNKKKINYIFISGGLTGQDIDKVFDTYITGLTFIDFKLLYSELNQYDFIVIDNSNYNIYKFNNDPKEEFVNITNEEILSDKIIISIEI